MVGRVGPRTEGPFPRVIRPTCDLRGWFRSRAAVSGSKCLDLTNLSNAFNAST